MQAWHPASLTTEQSLIVQAFNIYGLAYVLGDLSNPTNLIVKEWVYLR